MELTLENPAILQRCLRCLQDLSATAFVEATPRGLYFQALDDAKVSMAQIEIKSSGLRNYKFEVPGNKFSFGLPLKAINGMLSCMGTHDTLLISMSKPFDVLHMHNANAKDERKVSGTWELKLSDVDDERMGMPLVDYSAELLMPSDLLRQVVSSYTDSTSLMVVVNGAERWVEFTPGGQKLNSDGSEGPKKGTTRLRSNPDAADGVVIRRSPATPLRVNLACQFLTAFSKANQVAARVRMFLHPEVPTRVRYEMDETVQKITGFLQFFLAPQATAATETGSMS